MQDSFQRHFRVRRLTPISAIVLVRKGPLIDRSLERTLARRQVNVAKFILVGF
jgi:hypothetical protein